MIERAGEAAGFDMKIHPHMLRHACGFKLANDSVDTRTIQAYLGHKSIQHTVSRAVHHSYPRGGLSVAGDVCSDRECRISIQAKYAKNG